MNVRTTSLAICLVASVGFAAAPPEKKGDARVWSAKVQKTYEGVKDLSASFRQTTKFKNAAAGTVATGTMQVKKPGKMRWEFETPEKKSFVSDGKTMWMYEAEENQVIVNEFHQETASLTALNFLEGLGRLEKSFAVAMGEVPAGVTAKGATALVLTPKDEADVQFARILLVLDPKTALATDVVLTDSLGSETHIAFQDVTVNKGLADKTFVFEIPKNAEVIRPQMLQR